MLQWSYWVLRCKSIGCQYPSVKWYPNLRPYQKLRWRWYSPVSTRTSKWFGQWMGCRSWAQRTIKEQVMNSCCLSLTTWRKSFRQSVAESFVATQQFIFELQGMFSCCRHHGEYMAGGKDAPAIGFSKLYGSVKMVGIARRYKHSVAPVSIRYSLTLLLAACISHLMCNYCLSGSKSTKFPSASRWISELGIAQTDKVQDRVSILLLRRHSVCRK